MRSDLVTIAAATCSCKTHVPLSIAMQALKQKVAIIYFTRPSVYTMSGVLKLFWQYPSHYGQKILCPK